MSDDKVDIQQYLAMVTERLERGDINDLAWALAVRDSACALYVKAHPHIVSEEMIDDREVCQWLNEITLREVKA